VSTDERSSAEPGLNDILSRNIETLLTERKRQERRASVQQKFADVITAFAGSMPFVYVNASVFAAWGVINLGWIGLRPFDPNFVLLAMLASVEAIFLSTFVLISQNRMSTAEARRADLDLHISLLAEHEITRVLQLVARIAEKLGLEEASAAELAELKRDVAPDKVLEKIEKETVAELPAHEK
jgi:uncharacterized membrane protein